MNSPLRVSRLIEHNFMRIQHVDISPGGRCLVVLKGPNEAGKTSALQGLIAALSGKRFDPEQPVNINSPDGSGQVQVTLADDVANRLRVTVNWTPKERYLTVHQITDDQDVRLSQGQTVLDTICSALAFDPLKFMHSAQAEQFKMLMNAIGAAEEFKVLAAERKSIYEDRTAANRELTVARIQCERTPDPSPNAELVPLSLDELNRQQAARSILEREATEAENAARALHEEINSLTARIAAAQQRLEALQAQYGPLMDAAGKKAEALAAMPSGASQIEQALAHNNRCVAQKLAREAGQRAAELAAESDRYTKRIEQIDRKVVDLVATSNLAERVPGLSIDAEQNILHDGVPLSQASGMRKLMISLMVGAAMNKQLRVMCLDEGDRLDPSSVDALTKYAAENGYQVWMTANYAGQPSDDRLVVDIADGKDGRPAAAAASARKSAKLIDDPGISAMYTDVGLDAAPVGEKSKTATTVKPVQPIDLDKLDL